MVESFQTDSFGTPSYRTARADAPYLNKGYTGHTYDPETSLTYAHARYLDTAAHTFLSQDPVFWEFAHSAKNQPFLTNPQIHNSYSYALNNPIIYTDPDGRCAGPIIVICSGFVGALGGTVFQSIGDLNDYMAGEYEPRSFGENLATHSVATVNGFIVGAGVGATAYGAGRVGLSSAKTGVVASIIAGTLTAGTNLAGNRLLGRQTDVGTVVVQSGAAAISAGYLKSLPKVSSSGFYGGSYASRELSEEAFTNSVQMFAANVVGTVNNYVSSNKSSGGSSSGLSSVNSQLNRLVKALKGLLSTLKNKKRR